LGSPKGLGSIGRDLCIETSECVSKINVENGELVWRQELGEEDVAVVGEGSVSVYGSAKVVSVYDLDGFLVDEADYMLSEERSVALVPEYNDTVRFCYC
jgi:outer membrane protein assembly factor BamB